MVQINFARKIVDVKVVYYGPGPSGKTTNLEALHEQAVRARCGELTSINTNGESTLFFDYMPLNVGSVAGLETHFQLYTVPGQECYNSTRKLVLEGVDGLVFVADSSPAMLNENLESLHNLAENLDEYGKSIERIPLVIQWNKRDLPDALPIEDLEALINPTQVPTVEAVAKSGQGVSPTLKTLANAVLKSVASEATEEG